MKKPLFLIMYFSMCSAFSCSKLVDHTHAASILTVQNDSQDTIATTLSFGYPDLKLPPWNLSAKYLRSLPPRTKDYNYKLPSGTWKDEIKINSKDTLIIFFISQDTLRKYGYDSTGYTNILAGNKVSSYKFITDKDLDSLGNGLVTFP